MARATADASFHVGAARRIIGMMKAGGRGDERTQLFERRWFVVVAGLYTAVGRGHNYERLIAGQITWGQFIRDAKAIDAELDAELRRYDGEPRN